MDEFEARLVQMIIAQVEEDDTREGYSVAVGMRSALELYSGRDRARSLLNEAGHDY